MTQPSNHWKLGLFVVAGFALLVATAIFLGAQSMRKETVDYETYLDEAVTGLDVGSPVKFRGVTVGTVSAIDVAADRRHVEVTMDFGVSTMTSLGLAHKEGRKTVITVPPDIRVQLGTTGVTGVKYLQLDYFDPELYPPPSLPFRVPDNYIPAAPSALKNLEDSVVQAVQRLPDLMNRLIAVLDKTDALVGEIESQGLPRRTGALITEIEGMVRAANGTLRQIDARKLSRQAESTLAKLDRAIEGVNQLLAAAAGDKGVVKSAARTSDAFGDMARNASGLGRDLDDTLRDVRDAAQSIQRLSDALEREPDMLLKGRTKSP